MRRCSLRPSICIRSACCAASIAIGSTARKSSTATADSTRVPPKMMPITAVASEAGSVEAQDRADVTCAQPCNKPIKTRSLTHSAGRAAKIIVDYFDRSKAVSPRRLDQLVLAAPALDVSLNLGLGRLANVDLGLAAQNRGGKVVSVRHRHAPPWRRRRLAPEETPERQRTVPGPSLTSPTAVAARMLGSAGGSASLLTGAGLSLASGSSWANLCSSSELRLNPQATSRRCRSASAASEARGSAICIPAQETESSIHAAMIKISPGEAST